MAFKISLVQGVVNTDCKLLERVSKIGFGDKRKSVHKLVFLTQTVVGIAVNRDPTPMLTAIPQE